ncbi:MAG: DUF1553 domain-containing protein [Planctomycetaceae bacterium]|nr:DUF1553 domain-containing protein [Planctomycetaceae bacterium]
MEQPGWRDSRIRQTVARRSHAGVWRVAALRVAALIVLLTCGRMGGAQAQTVGSSSETTEAASETQQLAFFETHIRPVLVEYCYECHAAGAAAIKGGLQLDSRDGLLLGGDSGPALVVGQPAESLLISALRHETFEMPPQKRLSEETIHHFEQWIADGAVDPREAAVAARPRTEIDLAAGREFWAFRPIAAPEPPSIDDDWVKNDIDRFLVADWQAAGLQPAADATAMQLARRLYFVLIGLPPTPDQLQDFAAQYEVNPDVAVAELTDTLLQSPRFGERWGRHWLDVVRFAESSGGGRSLMFPHAWRFRDYVIQSFNNDKPFQQMVREQIAGDQLPATSDEQRDDQLVGSGYLVLGANNYEDQDKEGLRMDVVDEQITAIGETFLGQTLGCARCHDHKFDPIPTADYYALAGIFRSTRSLTPGNVSGYVTASLKTNFDAAALQAWEAEDQQLERRIKELTAAVGKASSSSPQRDIKAASLPGIIVDDDQAVLTGAWGSSEHSPPYIGSGYRHSNSPRTRQTAEYRALIPTDGEFVIRMSHNSQSSRTADLPVTIRHSRGVAMAHVNQQQPPNADGVFSELGKYYFDAGDEAVVTIHADQASAGYVIVDAVQFIPADQLATQAPAGTGSGTGSDPVSTPTSDVRSDAERAAMRAELAAQQEARKRHAKKKPELPQTMCVADEDAPADWHLHLRGDIRNLGPIVPRGFLQVVDNGDWNVSRPNIPPGTSGRLDLADWLASEQHPLTSRVYVNRIWQHAIGEGLVRTPDNFGSTGQRPTHPQLLDYLAWTFIHRHGWSTKQMLREICTSHAFRLSSDVAADVRLQDADNLHLARGFRRRLEAESLRDAILQVSGKLDLSCDGGLTIGEITTYDNEYDHVRFNSFHRSVYVPFLRNSMLEFFDVFDIANPNLVTGRRNVSTLPGQALFLMNSPWIADQSQLAAANFLAGSSGDQASSEPQITQVWLTIVGRAPTAEEMATTVSFLRESSEQPLDNWTAIFHALFCSLDFRYVD